MLVKYHTACLNSQSSIECAHAYNIIYTIVILSVLLCIPMCSIYGAIHNSVYKLAACEMLTCFQDNNTEYVCAEVKLYIIHYFVSCIN